jgi:hypothetical protein
MVTMRSEIRFVPRSATRLDFAWFLELLNFHPFCQISQFLYIKPSVHETLHILLIARICDRAQFYSWDPTLPTV